MTTVSRTEKDYALSVFPVREDDLLLANNTGVLLSRAKTHAETLGALMPTERLFRELGPVSVDGDVPFDSARHRPFTETLIASPGYSLEDGYEQVENVMLANNARELRLILGRLLGPVEFVLSAIKITSIQSGNEHFIFKLDCEVEILPQNQKSNISLVSTVSRHPRLDKITKADHLGLMAAREKEALLKDYDHKKLSFEPPAIIPPHYGFYEAEGKPSFYVAPFLDGYYELNQAYLPGTNGATERKVIVNGINQSRNSRFLDDAKADTCGRDVRRNIVAHSLLLSAASSKMIYTSIQAGDYMLNPDTQHLAWHCYRDCDAVAAYPERFDGMPAIIFSLFKSCLLKKNVTTLAHQIAMLIVDEEFTPTSYSPDGQPDENFYFTFAEEDITDTLSNLVAEGILPVDSLKMIGSILQMISGMILATSPNPDNPVYQKYLKRIAVVADACSHHQ